ncbi:MAG: response regulator transcription factor [Hamadaea sp.]|uniref:response regulator transcription factor n=1 Tax=Hamadaea sp. TaxID=2024425 RepID=UPI0017F8F296|nr:response regulator transcription factor [Hamadaea sp.]NUR71775.1 response regulator transcription factor [Hamadaea sp.]NUT19089.1 response regulator transcription factor [Hamadaea sp.]
MTLKVLIADDEPLIRAGLRVLVDAEADLTVVGEASDGAEALSQARTLQPDVILMDVRMPGVDGIEATRTILARMPQPPKIIVITTFENDDYVFAALQAGANGFLLKRSRPDELLSAVRTVASGDSLLFPASVRRLAAAFGVHRDAAVLRSLTEREAQVLRLLAEGRSNAEIATELYVGVETVKTHVGNILAKLGARDRIQAVILAYESGFISPAR